MTKEYMIKMTNNFKTKRGCFHQHYLIINKNYSQREGSTGITTKNADAP